VSQWYAFRSAQIGSITPFPQGWGSEDASIRGISGPNSAEARQTDRQVPERIIKVRPQAQSCAIFGTGFLETIIVREQVSEIVVRVGICRPSPQRLTILDDGLL
jgi:hypothetical protein